MNLIKKTFSYENVQYAKQASLYLTPNFHSCQTYTYFKILC